MGDLRHDGVGAGRAVRFRRLEVVEKYRFALEFASIAVRKVVLQKKGAYLLFEALRQDGLPTARSSRFRRLEVIEKYIFALEFASIAIRIAVLRAYAPSSKRCLHIPKLCLSQKCA